MKVLLAILCWTIFVTNAEKEVLYTSTSGEYFNWYPVSSSKQFKFQIRAKAFTLNLASYPVNEFPKIEIGITHPYASNSGVIWRDNVDVESVKIEQQYNANELKFMGYWVTWHNNIIKIGLEGEMKEFLSWNDPNPFSINYIGVHTIASNNKGIWIIEKEFSTPSIQVSFNN